MKRLVAALLLAVLAPFASAHDFELTEVFIAIEADGSFRGDLTLDVDALALGVSPELPDAMLYGRLAEMSPAQLAIAEEQARDTLLRRVRFRFDGERAEPELEFPQIGQAPTDGRPSLFGTTARFTGSLPEEAQELVFFASRALGPTFVTITDRRNEASVEYPLLPGEESPAFSLVAPSAPTGTFWRYLVLGFEHILPKGLDHILFVLGLFLIATRWRDLLIQVSAFTLAHTLTLGLSILGVVSLPGSIVEPLIALSIAWIAIENLIWREISRWRPIVVFVFGLLHGLGFAGVLSELGLPAGQRVTALLSFNIGVEFGQLAVIAAAMLLVGWAREREGYRRGIVIPASLIIGAVGLYWTVERLLG